MYLKFKILGAESLADGKKITVNLKVMSVYYLKFQFTSKKP
jgi:hypothetical protein